MSKSSVKITHYSARWCHFCQTMKPEIAKLEKQGFKIRKVNVDRVAKTQEDFNRDFPNGVPITELRRGDKHEIVVGATKASTLEKKIKKMTED